MAGLNCHPTRHAPPPNTGSLSAPARTVAHRAISESPSPSSSAESLARLTTIHTSTMRLPSITGLPSPAALCLLLVESLCSSTASAARALRNSWPMLEYGGAQTLGTAAHFATAPDPPLICPPGHTQCQPAAVCPRLPLCVAAYSAPHAPPSQLLTCC